MFANKMNHTNHAEDKMGNCFKGDKNILITKYSSKAINQHFKVYVSQKCSQKQYSIYANLQFSQKGKP